LLPGQLRPLAWASLLGSLSSRSSPAPDCSYLCFSQLWQQSPSHHSTSSPGAWLGHRPAGPGLHPAGAEHPHLHPAGECPPLPIPPIVCSCHRRSRGKLDLFSSQASYQPMNEYPTYHTHGRFSAPGKKQNPYSDVSSGAWGLAWLEPGEILFSPVRWLQPRP
uniref:Uncharacterized protein n=1 Tax=Gopherus evgoodei TaxID=1825980 RepID=A0A8C4WA13_9SAUR